MRKRLNNGREASEIKNSACGSMQPSESEIIQPWAVCGLEAHKELGHCSRKEMGRFAAVHDNYVI